jgi:hypothetical protein
MPPNPSLPYLTISVRIAPSAQVGSTGDPPVPGGDSPTGSEGETDCSRHGTLLRKVAFKLPPGQWPGEKGSTHSLVRFSGKGRASVSPHY